MGGGRLYASLQQVLPFELSTPVSSEGGSLKRGELSEGSRWPLGECPPGEGERTTVKHPSVNQNPNGPRNPLSQTWQEPG